MNVWIIRESEAVTSKTSKKFRYSRLADFFSKQSHKVTFFISSFDHTSKSQRNPLDLSEIAPTIDFILLDSNSYSKHISLRRMLNQFQLAFSFNKKVKLLEKPDVILCSIPSIQLAKEATKYANKHHVPIILDIVDLWPDLFQHFLPKLVYFAARPYIWFLRKELEYTINNVDAVTALTDSYLQWGLDYRKHPLNQSKTVPFGYDSVVVHNLDKSFNVIFVGSITRQFDFDTFFDAVEKLKEVNFTVVGSGDLMDHYKQKYIGLSNLRWTGWLEAKELENELKNAGLAIMPYKNLPHFQKNITNKFSEYLAYGLPILTGVTGEMKDLLDQHHCGVFYSNSEELIHQILDYKNNPDKLIEHSNNALKLQRDHFDIDKINEVFLNFIEEVHSRYHH